MSLLRPALCYLAAAAVLALAAWHWGRTPAADPVAPGPAPADVANAARANAAPVARDVVRVTAVRGTVEQTRGGPWRPLLVGSELVLDDSLRTGEGAAAELAIGPAQIAVAERTEMRVGKLSGSVHHVRIQSGRLAARYPHDKTRSLRVEDASGAIAEARGGDVGILETGDTLAVAAESGTATLRSAGKSVEVHPGRLAVAAHGEAPEPAQPIPVEVLLRLARSETLPDDRFAHVQGATVPGSRVRVNDVPAQVDTSGRFTARIPVHDGKNEVVAVIEDALGRTIRRKLPAVVVSRRGRIDDLSIRWGGGESTL